MNMQTPKMGVGRTLAVILIFAVCAVLYFFVFERDRAAIDENLRDKNARPEPVAPEFKPGSPFKSKATFRVVAVIDGDTLDLVSDGNKTRVRLIGIDTPEKDSHLYAEAKKKLSELVSDRDVALEFDVEKTDKYERQLAYIWTPSDGSFGDILVNKEMVRTGYASVYTVPPNVNHAKELVAAQKLARNEKAGLWGLKREPAEYYLGSKNSQVFHRNTCKRADDISEHNRVIFKSIDEALDEGRSPCRDCKP